MNGKREYYMIKKHTKRTNGSSQVEYKPNKEEQEKVRSIYVSTWSKSIIKKRIRVSYNLKPEVVELVKFASKALNEDMSSVVNQALEFRLGWMKKEMDKVKKQIPEEDIAFYDKHGNPVKKIDSNWYDEYLKDEQNKTKNN